MLHLLPTELECPRCGYVFNEQSEQRRGSASNHPKVKIAREWRGAIVSVTASLVVGVLAVLQHWPMAVSITFLGASTGLWALDAMRSGRRR